MDICTLSEHWQGGRNLPEGQSGGEDGEDCFVHSHQPCDIHTPCRRPEDAGTHRPKTHIVKAVIR
jgi:hypothetical protein